VNLFAVSGGSTSDNHAGARRGLVVLTDA